MRFSLLLLTISSALPQDAGATHGGTQFSWRYSNDSELHTILAYLRAVIKP